MLDDREYVSEALPKPRCPATIALLVVNAIVFGFQWLAARFYPSFQVDTFFALSLDGLRHGFLWQLLTFQFMHGGFWHIFLNSWAIFVFGRAVEITLGWRRMLNLYFLSGVIGGLFQMLGAWLLPGLFGDAGVVCASAGAFGLVAAFAVLYPNQRLYLLLFLIIPIKMRATTLSWLSVAVAAVGIFLPWFAPYLPPHLGINEFFGNVAHAAHLGGIVTGFLFARQLIRGDRVPPIIDAGAKSPLKITPASD